MRNKKSLVFSLISILSPVSLVIFLLITLISDKYFLNRYQTNIFIEPFMFFLITGWIIGLGTGIAGLVFSIMQKKECGKTSRSVSISILGIVLNLLWLSGIVLAFPA
ncbi:MAG: hypothetical protein K6E97_10535 [Treponema sp.]|nr:hypothetical protein [Treponema sp.]